MAKIWDKGHDLHSLIERFTVGNDYLLDRRLAAGDAIASIAHAAMLQKIGVLTTEQREALEGELRRIARMAADGEFTIERGQEDSHTAIEEALTDALGEVGKRIHAGRSRNDQSSMSTRLFAREGVLYVRKSLLDTVTVILGLAAKHEKTPMPGRTHLQTAMPSTVGLFAASHAELLLDAYDIVESAYRLVNRSPLGAAAGYGAPLDLDRELVADLLGFDCIHHNVMAAVGARGHIELAVLNALDHVGLVLSRLAQDLILFSLPEFGYFTIPEELTTGSSIMPQKKNPDGLELLRGKSATLSSYADRVRAVLRSLPAGYNRDVQETKEPLVNALDLTLEMLAVTVCTVAALGVNEVRLRAGFTPDLFAADEATRLVQEGMSFRDAYRAVAESLPELAKTEIDIDAHLALRSATGSPGNLDLATVERGVTERRERLDVQTEAVTSATSALFGSQISLFTPASTDS
jgi:argininosuccinate lyase